MRATSAGVSSTRGGSRHALFSTPGRTLPTLLSVKYVGDLRGAVCKSTVPRRHGVKSAGNHLDAKCWIDLLQDELHIDVICDRSRAPSERCWQFGDVMFWFWHRNVILSA